MAPASTPSALHVNDCASTAARMLAVARQRGYRWDFEPLAAPTGTTWSGPLGQARRAALGASWLARLQLRSRGYDLVHYHDGSILRHTKVIRHDFALHLHGTDIRTLQYAPGIGPVIRRGVARAAAVFYSTPDLAEHTLPLRPDARLVPVPVPTRGLPQWSPPDHGEPTVFFASRWEPAKGGARMLEVAREVTRAVRGRARVVGLAWGAQHEDAAAAGVQLLPRMSPDAYLRALSSATVVVGQSAGILAASELEALSVGAPLVVPSALELYSDDPPPVLAVAHPDDVASAVLSVLTQGAAEDAAVRRDWVATRHSPERAVDIVAAAYRAVTS